MRVACVWLPHFAVQSLRRADPELETAPLVVTDGARVIDLSDEAARLSLHPAMTVPQARAVAPEATFRARSPALEEAARAALCDLAASFSPRLEPRGDRVYFDVDGLSRLWPSERELARAIANMGERLRLEARVGIAGDKSTAHVAALSSDEPVVVAPGRDAAFLAPLPVEVLFAAAGTSDELIATLRRWGIRRIGELATLPSGGVALRLGREGALLGAIARGAYEDPLVPRAETLVFEEALELEWPVEELGSLAFVLRRLIENLVARLVCRGLSVREMELLLRLDKSFCDTDARAGTGEEARAIGVAAPTRDVPTLVELARLALERTPPPAPVTGVVVRAIPGRARPAQLGFFEPPGPSPDKLATTLARLAALVGNDRVGAPALVDKHAPGAFKMIPFAPPKNGNGNANGIARALVLHAMRPARDAEVHLDRGKPRYVQATGVAGQVLAAAGPFRVREGWWEMPIQRDYYDIELSDGAVYRMYQDLVDKSWFVEGWYE